MTTREFLSNFEKARRQTNGFLKPHLDDAAQDVALGLRWRTEAIAEALAGSLKVMWSGERCGTARLELSSCIEAGRRRHKATLTVRDDESDRLPALGFGATADEAAHAALRWAIDYYLGCIDYLDPKDGKETFEELCELLPERLKAKAESASRPRRPRLS